MNLQRLPSKQQLQAFHTHGSSIKLIPGFWCKDCPKRKANARRKRP